MGPLAPPASLSGRSSTCAEGSGALPGKGEGWFAAQPGLTEQSRVREEPRDSSLTTGVPFLMAS